MMLGTRLRTWAVGTSDSGTLPQVACVEAGHALLLHLEGHLNPRALAFARMIAPDPDHTVVVADVPPDGPIELWHAVAALLGRRRGGYRLVLGKHSRDAAVMTGQWLAERLNCPVLVPDGDVVMAPGGALFSSALQGVGWVRFRRGRAPQQDSRHFPIPDWTFPGAEQIWQPGPVSVVEPLPAGVWIRPLESADDQRALLISGLVPRSDLMTVVLGSPNSRPVPMAEISRFCHSVPPEHRDRVRFVQYGPVEVLRSSVGQALADQLGAPVTFYAGLPSTEGTVHVVSPEGGLGWRSFARELRYHPRAAAAGRIMPPQLVAYDTPMPGASELSPGVYWYASDAVVEIVQSGLWLRPPVAPVNADHVRTAPSDPRHAAVVFDTSSRHLTDRMQALAGEILATMDPAMRRMFRVLPAAVLIANSHHVPVLPARGMVVESVPGRWTAESVELPADHGVELMAPRLALPALPAASVDAPVEATVVVSADMIEDADVVDEPDAVPAVAEPAGPAAAGDIVDKLDSATVAVPFVAMPVVPAVDRDDELDSPTLSARFVAKPAEPVVPGASTDIVLESAVIGLAGGTVDEEPPAAEPVALPVVEAPSVVATDAPATPVTESADPIAVTAEPPAAAAIAEPPVVAEPPAAAGPIAAAAGAGAEPPVVAEPAAAPEPEAAPKPIVTSAVDAPPAAMPTGLRLESSVPDFGIDFAAIAVPAPAPKAEAPKVESTPQPDAAAILEPEPLPEPTPVVAPEPEPVAVAEPEAVAARAVAVQPVPAAGACAVPPDRGLTEERAWLRKTLNSQYDVAASTVSRMLSQVPGLRVGMQADEVLADLVGVRVYLTGDSAGLDEAVRSAVSGPHVPLARVVTSGLKRLPSYRGATQLWAAAGESELDWYRNRLLVSEWAFLTATTAGRPAMDGEVEFRVWSMTARRTQLIDPSVDDQVLFVPGTNFKVLEVRDEPNPVVLLRELSTAEIGEDGQVNTGRSMFDDLALGGLDQAAQAWAQVAGAAAARPTASAPPGLLSTAMERTSA
ncbi:hypothetical protein [Kutzneria sp. CA-103260]|uniref:hypothetical protein n=1 Tax=Kutzneria sp. CA-103260 TaxID=2802641 RepID=UPI001BAA9DE5|nr:hypothetical protein [Kutzneria sp. CA-103260]QUQ62810.1 hypothetical protein JJ691_05220 [Kutzneria sp. CA-103260]